MDIEKPQLIEQLNNHNLRPTEARRLVLALLMENNDHPNTDQIIRSLYDKGFKVSIATLYQNLEKLVEVGLLIRIKGPDGVMRFDANIQPHHHLICDICGKMTDIKINGDTLPTHHPIDFQTGLPVEGWDIDHIKIEYKGTCSNCKK